MSGLSAELTWWITMFDVPAMAALFAFVWRTHRENNDAISHMREILDMRNAQMREALSGFKLEVAKGYASITDLKDLEVRLVAHLLRIESKLDHTAMKTEALHARDKNKTQKGL